MVAVRFPEARTNLPSELTSFIGRRRDIATIRALMAESRLVTLTGMGGVGKTRLARRVAASSVRSFAGGVWQVELADLNERALVVNTIASAIGLREQRESWTVAALVERLRSRRILVLLDNCEHLVDTCAEVVDELLKGCPKLRVVATSREPLGVLGERVYGVHPLAVPDERRAGLDSLLKYDSVSLFFDRVAEVCPDFEVTDDNIDAVAELCVRLEGVPLAIELAAVWLRTLSPAELMTQLTEHYDLLRRGHRGAPPRQQSLRAVIDWSYQLCAPAEQLLWQRAAIFAQGFELDAVTALYSEELSGLTLIDLVDRLVAKSVLFVDAQADHARYRMPAIIRDYGLERLTETGEDLRIRDRHRRWCVAMTSRARGGWVSTEQLGWFRRIRRELPNIRAAIEFSLSSPSTVDDVVQVIADLIDYWISMALLSESLHWLHRVQPDQLTAANRVTCMRTMAILATVQGDREFAASSLERAVKLASDGVGDTETAWLSMAGALAAMYAGEHSAAQPELEIAEGQFRRAGDLNGLVWALAGSTVTQSTSAHPELTQARYRRWLAVADHYGEQWSRAYCLWAVAFAQWRGGDTAHALESLRASLHERASFDDEFALAQSLELLAWIMAARKRGAEAATLLGRAHAAFVAAGSSVTALVYLVEGHERCTGELRATLSAAAYDAAYERGRTLRLTDYFAVTDQHAAVEPIEPPSLPLLTARERQVAGLIAQGLMNKEIAERLLISPRTAETHVEHILVKLGFTSRSQIAALMASGAQAF